MNTFSVGSYLVKLECIAYIYRHIYIYKPRVRAFRSVHFSYERWFILRTFNLDKRGQSDVRWDLRLIRVRLVKLIAVQRIVYMSKKQPLWQRSIQTSTVAYVCMHCICIRIKTLYRCPGLQTSYSGIVYIH